MRKRTKTTASSFSRRSAAKQPPPYKAEEPIDDAIVEKALAYRPQDYRLLLERLSGRFKFRSWESLDRLYVETLRFLVVKAENPSTDLPASDYIYTAWFEFLVHTEDYRNFCEVLGRFVDHRPTRETNRNTENTQSLINGRFKRVWPDLYPDYDPPLEHWAWLDPSTREFCRKEWKRQSDCFA